jgi:hypothetical protein
MTKLDEIAVNVELVLISLIEGVALVTLAEQIVVALQEPDWYRYLPYMIGGFLILLVFWTQSILHALSFIRWPIRVEHMFLYFASALLQIIAYTGILHVGSWFFWWSMFSLVAMGMYFLDLWILEDSYPSFAKIKGGAEFLKKVEERHLYEMKYLVPAALGFNIICMLAVLLVPDFFQNVFVYMIPGWLQVGFTGYALYDCVKNFRTRSAMIAALFSEPSLALVTNAPSPASHASAASPPSPASNTSNRRRKDQGQSAKVPDTADPSQPES